MSHTWVAHNARLRALVREELGKRSRPTAAVLDSQSVKSDPHGGEVGYGAGKKIKGRKRRVLVDTLGLLLGVFVTPASTLQSARLAQAQPGRVCLVAPDLGGRRVNRGRLRAMGQEHPAKTGGRGGQALAR